MDVDKCIACGLCAQKCPKKVDDEFNMGLSKRKAIYIKYGQSVPLKYAIDPENCIYLTRGKCRACEKFCPTGAINFEDREEIITLNVGAIITAPGFKPFDPSSLDSYAYTQIPDVVTSLEYERLLSAGGPYLGHLVRPSDEQEPRKIAWIQCVGSRDINKCSAEYCSSVCCMYAIKQALVTREHLSSNDVEEAIFYMDIRAHGKEFEKYYEGAREKGLKFIKARPHTLEPGKDNRGVVIRYVDEDGSLRDEYYDMVVLSIGLSAPEDAPELARILGFELNSYGFARTSSFNVVETTRKGIFVTGAFQAPKDIPQAVTEASTAAAEASKLLSEVRGSLTREKVYPREREVACEEPRVGVFVCSCGINIASVVDVNELVEYARSLPHVEFVENNLFTCSADTQSLIVEKIKEHKLNRIVVAACTPRTHEPLFQETLKDAGLNEFLLEMANIRNQNSWVHQDNPKEATEKAKDQIRMAVAKVVRNEPLRRQKIKVNQRALVIGGGVAGMVSALTLANLGYDCVVVEKSSTLGGNAWNLDTTYLGEKIVPWLRAQIHRVENHPRIEVLKNASLTSVKGSIGNFEGEIRIGEETRNMGFGAVIVATGAREYTPVEYLYGEDPRVLTHFEMEERLKNRSLELRKEGAVVFIQCVGSRDEERPYCSRVCCTHTMLQALRIKEMMPEKEVFVLYRDIRTYGLREKLFKKARDKGVVFIRYSRDRKPDVIKEGEDLFVEITDPISRVPLRIYTSYLCLATAVIPRGDTSVIEMFKLSKNEEGFITEAHPKLRPVDATSDGVFLAGMCHYPKPLDESIAQAKAAAVRASVILSREYMELDAIKSYVTERCDGCALCVDVCPYNALSLIEIEDVEGEVKRRISADPALCKGCGLCEATCPKGGILVHGFTTEQITSQIKTLLPV